MHSSDAAQEPTHPDFSQILARDFSRCISMQIPVQNVKRDFTRAVAFSMHGSEYAKQLNLVVLWHFWTLAGGCPIL